ncbi:hypothetical protein PRIPAC_91857 [Pristionchus pacificus]|uniref:Uncharacterized protein n=1 Tax=Pristionchus pacificus TaxID=54126 RepID=A0A2A6BPX9_PRIPA|nr:hypothetical protein PRIPAC_91857 [Pristionchus pacificus]|eukprot:PDM67947.1 hypothetical protein PRIPAC_45991 [Pristionchus pacificus]
MSSPDPFFDWYHSPLSLEDCLAGGAMILLCAIFIPLTVLVSLVMWKADKEIIGYRYLISASFADINCMLQYGFLNGIAILTKNPLTHSEDGRSAMQIYIDIIWFSLCLHYPLVAWSRFAAIKTPIWFRSQQRWNSYVICLGVYLVAVIMARPEFYTLRFRRDDSLVAVVRQILLRTVSVWTAGGGFRQARRFRYLVQGMSAMFLYLHIFCVVVPLILYLWTIALILRDRNAAAGAKSRGQMSVEKRLMVPCIIGNVIFVIGQVAITIGTGTGKWATWTICLIFVINSAANCVMLLLFSPSLI